jgi:stress response protein YsnF
VRSYVVETPVSEQVNLRQENVHIERRPDDRALTGSEEFFQDRTIHLEERSEEAVVSKEARVREEIMLSKEVEQSTETVSDTVRRTEVEVDDERTGGTGSRDDKTVDRTR